MSLPAKSDMLIFSDAISLAFFVPAHGCHTFLFLCMPHNFLFLKTEHVRQYISAALYTIPAPWGLSLLFACLIDLAGLFQ